MSAVTPVPLLSASGLSFTAGGTPIVEDFALEVGAGEVVGLIGPNGAGKTTAIDLLSGFRDADAGSVRLGGRELAGMPPDRRARLGLARTFQESPAVPQLSARDHVRLALEAGGRSRASGRAADEFLERVGLDGEASKPGELLPIGKRRLLDVARALATLPEVLLLDEPFAGLERSEERLLDAVLAELRREGRAVVIVDHRLALLGQVVDSVLVLVQGRLLTRGTMDEVLRDPVVQRAYLGGGPTAEAVS